MKCIVLVVLCLAYAEAGAIPSGSRDPSSEQEKLIEAAQAVQADLVRRVCQGAGPLLKNCRTYFCTEAGVVAFRDIAGCVPELPAGGKCEPGTISAVDCNTCVCTEIGTLVCTEKNCNTPEAKIPVPINALFDFVRQNRNLNTELARETRKKEEEPLKICDPEKEFRMDCNRCICDIEGLSFSCTRLDCNIHNVGRRKREPSVPGSLVDVMRVDGDMQTTPSIRRTRGVTQEALKTCQPGQEFRMDCNRCLCDSEGLDFSCTRIDCNAQNGKSRRRRDTSEQVTMECTPGSVFDVDCNVCRCTTDGHHAMCTVKRCGASTTVNNDLSAPLTDSDPNFRCNPGEQFKRDCNDCTCSADGKSVFCTVRFCDQGVTPPSSL